jgi:dihydroorotate dehydrogenase (NAD+) catalytic subunit
MMNNPLETKIGNMILRSPLLTTSGTSGSSSELEHFEQSESILNAIGAFTTKSVTLEPRKGNPEPRIVETRSGIINSIGLQNKGAAVFVREELPRLIRYKVPIIVNISAATIEEFGILTDYLMTNDENSLINGIEINVSCPNVKEGGVAFGANPKTVEQIVRQVRKYAGDFCTIITKLTPNITDIKVAAKAAIHAGTHALSMINTLKAMTIDINTRKPFLGNEVGGLSGPAIRPVGVYMVYECFKIAECKKGDIPIIGMGGITNCQDALEYIMAGASAVGIGTQWFVNPDVFQETFQGLKHYLDKNQLKLKDIIGIAHSPK